MQGFQLRDPALIGRDTQIAQMERIDFLGRALPDQ
jgi:hypothetical protein